MSRYEHLMDEQQQQKDVSAALEGTQGADEDPFPHRPPGMEDVEPLASNYLTMVVEEPASSDEQHEEEDDEEKKKKKKKRPSNTGDDQSFSERRDDDDDDDDDHHSNKPFILANAGQSSPSDTHRASPPASSESNQKQTDQSKHEREQQMEMSHDSMNESMIMSQDSLKQRSMESLDSDQEMQLLSSNLPPFPTSDTDEFILAQHADEPTPSRMSAMTFDKDELEPTARHEQLYPLISNEIETGQLPVIHARRTASENSLYSNPSSTIQMYDNHSFSASCLANKDDLTPSNEYLDHYQQQMLYDVDSQKNQQIYRATTRHEDDDDDEHYEFNQNGSPSTNGVGFFDRVKAFVSKPVEIVQEAMENRRKQRSTSSLNSNADLNEKQAGDIEQDSLSSQHFPSAHDFSDEDQTKLVRSPELHNIDRVKHLDQQILLPHLQNTHRTQSDSALDNTKRDSLTATASNEASEEFLPTISKDNSIEFILNSQDEQRHSTPYDDVMEKESSPEHSESSNLPTSAFSDAFEPTSSCQRPLALSTVVPQPAASDEAISEEEFDQLAANYVHQVLNDAVAHLSGDHEDSSSSNKSDKLPPVHDTSSDDDDDDEVLREEDEDGEHKQPQMTTDTSSFALNDRYSADESSNTRDQSADEETSARSSATATPVRSLRRTYTDTDDFELEQTAATLAPPIVRRSSQSDTGTYFSAVSPSSGDYTDVQSNYSTTDEAKFPHGVTPKSNSSQYLTANDETPNLLTSDDNDYVDESGTVNYAYDGSSSDDQKTRQTRSTVTDEKSFSEKYSGEGEESSSGNQGHVQRRKRSSDQRVSLSNEPLGNTLETSSTKNVSFKLDLNETLPRSPRLSTSGGGGGGGGGGYGPRQESLDSPTHVSNEQSMVKILREEILRTNLETLKQDLELDHQSEDKSGDNMDPSSSSPSASAHQTTAAAATKSTSYSDYDAGSESDRDPHLGNALKSTIQEELNQVYHDKESIIDQIKMKFERSLDRLIEKTLANDESINKSDLVSPFTDRSLNRSLPNLEQSFNNIVHSHSEQFLQACPDELDYGTLQRFSSDSCIIIRVPERYTPSSTLIFDQIRTDQADKSSLIQPQTSAFSFYTKQDHLQPSSSPIAMVTSNNDLIENISPIPPYTPRSLDDSSVDFGEREMNDISDEFVLVKNLSSPTAAAASATTASEVTNESPSKEIKHDTPPNSSSSSSDKHESPDLLDILQHQCEYPPLDTGFDLRAGTTLETVYESPELRQDEIKSAISTLSLTASETNRPLSTDHGSSNTPNTDDSLLEFERIEMELFRNPSTANVIDTAREIRSSMDSLIHQHTDDNNQKVESFIEKHFPSIEKDVQHVLNDILDSTSDLSHSISSQSDATTVIYKSQRHSIDDDYVQVTHEDLQNQGRHMFSSDEDILRNQIAQSSHDKRRLSAPTNDRSPRRLKTPSSSSSSSSSFSSTSRSVIYSQQHGSTSQPSHRLLQAETDLASFKQQQQTQSATDLPFLPPFVNATTMNTKRQAAAGSSTPSLAQPELLTSQTQTKKKTRSHPGSLGGAAIPPRSLSNKEDVSSSRLTSISPHSSSSSHHSDDCYCADQTTTATASSHPH